MTEGTAGRTLARTPNALIAATLLLASCSIGTLKPAWQQDPTLYHHGVPSRPSQTSKTPHLVARVVYASPERIERILDQQGDVADAQRGLARMGDGTVDVALQDAATGKWIVSYLCGGTLFVGGLPNQAYRIVLKNRTPMPLECRVGVDGRDAETGAAASLSRGHLRLEPQGQLALDHTAQGPLKFKSVNSDAMLYDLGPRCRPGLIQIAVFLAADAPSIGPEKLRSTQIAPLGFFPLGAPEQYR